MGADFITEHVTISKTKKPNWGAAHKYIKTLAKRDLREWPNGTSNVFGFDGDNGEDFDKKSCAETLINDLEALCCAWAGKLRSANVLLVGNKRMLITGGESWGDSPSEFFDSLRRLVECGVTRKAGFDW